MDDDFDDEASSGEDAPMLEARDCEVVRGPADGEAGMMGRREGEASSADAALEAALVEPETRFWEAIRDLLLTLLETGSRSKGALHALAPHCLRPFARLTPDVVQGAPPRARAPAPIRPPPRLGRDPVDSPRVARGRDARPAPR
jgi:hypothetical protein